MASSHKRIMKTEDAIHLEKSDDDVPATEPGGSGDIPLGYFPVTTEEKAMSRALNRKLDIFLLPFLSLLYLFNGLDRGNVGNAQTQGFTNDIGTAASDLNLAVSLFFITFVIFQPISAAIGRRVGAKNWIPFIMLSWGAITISHAFIHGRAQLIALRLLIGAFEAGFYPTALFYLSNFYTRFDLAVRIALFYGQYAIAGAFSGAIAYGVFHINGSLNNWQYLFIIEGALTSGLAIISWFWMPAGPGSAWFLTKEEQNYAVTRIQIDVARYVQHTYGADGIEKADERLSKRDMIETMKDWKLWYVLFFNICASIPGQAFSVFLPLVVKGLGYTSIEANLMSVPPYVCGAVGLYLFALSSDRVKERGFHILVGLSICLIGLIITVTTVKHNPSRYAGLCIMTFGSYVSAPLTAAWLSGNTPEPGKRSLVLGFNGFGNLAGIIGSELFQPKYAPRYLIPFYVTLGFIATSMMGYLAYRYSLLAVNKWRQKKMEGWTQEGKEAEYTSNNRYGDKKYTFVYGL
ncbi:major facilitator superfamily domain-containing protein [Xylogone sp. PMI_703]|nr:major facilitator superfamily domain-containing protein [Xylogone sp. PMI_703]